MKLPVNYDTLTPQERRQVREEYVRRQEGKCSYCKHPLKGPTAPAVLGKRVSPGLFPANFFKWPVHLHHSHATGLTIGAVHCHCNAVLWQYDGE